MASPESSAIRKFLKENMTAQKPGQTIEEVRQAFEKFSSVIPVAPDIKVEKVSVEGIPAEWVSAPNADSDMVLLYLHGGAYIMGSCSTHRDLAAKLSRASAAKVLVIDYRLAPEHPYPAALEDAVTAYRWLISSGHSPEQIAVGGDSAGGGLTLSLLLSLREAGDALPSAAVLLSPWTDLEGTGDSMETRADADPRIRPMEARNTPALYLGDLDRRDPFVSPIYADLTGLPPMLVHVGDDEILLDDSVRLVERAREAGVDVSFMIYDEMWHVFHQFDMPEAAEAIAEIGGFVQKRIGARAKR
ncbi:alpha/beta hydrolase [Mesobacillus foraminis]|uniref:alpha/beta hydrolase n=1 Tax=Mesobacillus foraminis TaxID=279826 RepID=UPI001BE6B261|nr:alpha/beta hydrolase [Mesobacillus foraminis]MBT2757264.1 alpha/beta hydrolase [Mesobacillus foraminis]